MNDVPGGAPGLSREAVCRALMGFERRSLDEAGTRHAAVNLLLVARGAGTDDVAMVLTRRSSRLRGHSGQWALPGGRVEPGESTRDGALRELEEELGVRLSPDRVLGELDDYVTRSGYRITPTVVWAADVALPLRPNPAEVASVHLVPVSDLDVEPLFVTIAESVRPVIQVPVLGGLLHAPTGAILHQFREVVLHERATRVAHYEQPVFAWR